MIHRACIVVALAGCLSLPEQKKPACSTDADCDTANGEVCEENTCWGNPPAGPFMVVVTPPIDRGDLVSAELRLDSIPADGWTGDLPLESGATLAGRVEEFCPGLCDQRSLAATITVVRPSSFAGGPGFHTVFVSKPGIPRSSPPAESSFSVVLPKTKDGDHPYTVTVVPDGRGDMPGSTQTPAQLVPPQQIQLQLQSSIGAELFQLGGAALPVIDGTIQSSLGAKLAHYRVVALGHWQKDAPIVEVSTVSYTATDGRFSVTLSAGLVDNVDIVAKSYDGPAPVLHLGSVPPATATFSIVQPQGVGQLVDVPVRVRGVNGGGEVVPVAGAVVAVTAVTTPVFPSTAFSTVTAEDTTGDDGTVHLKLMDGMAYGTLYRLRVIPPASSNLGVILDDDFAIAADHSDTRLDTRLAVHGIVVDSAGDPIGGVAVTAQAALRFMWSLDPAPQAFLAEIPAATSITSDAGDFVVFVDPLVAGTWGSYDFAFEPANGSPAPNWLVPQLDLPREPDRTDYDLGTVSIPDAASIHGRIVDGTTVRNPVAGGEVRIFATPSYPTLCMQVQHAPSGCPIPAILEGHGTSDDLGIVRMRLPRRLPGS